MSDFKQECTIKAWIEPSGSPAKYTWAYSLVQFNQLEVVSATGFLGKVDQSRAEITVTLAALEQASRLRYEKVEFRSGFTDKTPLDQQLGRFQRNRELKSDLLVIFDIWNNFRFKRLELLHESERSALQLAARSARKK